MKKIIPHLIILILPTLFCLGCTKLMEDMNNDPKSLTNARLSADGVLFKQHIINMEENLFNLTTSWEYQIQENLNADVFAGYTMHPGNFNSSTTNDNYNWNTGWNGWAFTIAQTNLTDFLALKSQTFSGKLNSDFYSYGLVLKVLTAIPLIDGFGPFPYLQYGTGTNPTFNNVDSIYLAGFIPELNAVIDTLNAYTKRPSATRVQLSGADISTFGGDIVKWIKLANTLKLRLAIRISNADPISAQKYITQTLAETHGFIDKSTGDFAIDCAANGVTNPFSFLTGLFNDCNMSADMQSFLGGFQDPREAVYFLPAKDDTVKLQGGDYAGVRPGVTLTQNKGHYAGYSLLNVPNNFMIFSGAESYFLKAEAAIKSLGGLTPADAQTLYEDGVKASFTLHGLSDAQAIAYLSSNASPANYVDYSNRINNYPATTTITPKWTGADQLEKIITQKWISIYPLGVEAWAEFRRTGFPKLKIPKNMETSANVDGTIPAGQFVRRMPYPSNILALSPDQAKAAITKYLNGKDDGFQKLWWQK
jgi:hypothetical protein